MDRVGKNRCLVGVTPVNKRHYYIPEIIIYAWVEVLLAILVLDVVDVVQARPF